MAKKNYDIVNTTINLFKNGKIICKSPTLGKKVISYAQKVITIFKKDNNIEIINKINNIYKNKEKAEVTIEQKSMFYNMIRLCIQKLCFGKPNYLYDLIQNKIIPIAFANKDRNGGYIQYTTLASNQLHSKYKYITQHMQLKLIGANDIIITPKDSNENGGGE